MDIKKIFPVFNRLDVVQGIEREILKHKNKSTIGFILMMIFGLFQVLSLPFDPATLKEIAAGRFPLNRFLWLLVAVVGFMVYILFKRTGFLLKEAEEPFKYTFWIEPFTRAKDEPEKAFDIKSEDRFHQEDRKLLSLLHHDLMERLNERIKRLSLLNVDSLKQSDPDLPNRLTSHIHIEGYYTIRVPKKETKKKEGCIIIEVIPRVRVGSVNMPVTLANPVKFEIEKEGESFVLKTEDYDQIVERVYSSIATEIYKQIDADLEKKLKLFPTNFSRTHALYYEARDFSRSNTLDAFERSISLYEKARRCCNISFSKILVKFFISIPFFWRFKVKNAHLYARIQIGWAQSLISRRIISSCSGRRVNPIFDVLKELNQVITILMKLHNRINRKWKLKWELNIKGEKPKLPGVEEGKPIEDKKNIEDRRNAVMAYLGFPRDTYWRRLFLRPLEEIYEKQSRLLFGAFSVCALTYYLLNAYKKAEEYLENAKAVAPSLTEENPLYIFTRGAIEAKIDKEILVFRNAVDLAPQFQVAQFYLAYWSEMQFRMSDYLTPDRAKSVLNEYDKVLKINPGNIAALAAQGYINWLLGCADTKYLVKAKEKFLEGCEIKSINRETYIGELNYGLARIAAEEGRFVESCDYYTQAIAADPGVGAYSPPEIGKTQSRYYEYISLKMLQRFECFKKVFENKMKKELDKNRLFKKSDFKDLESLVEKIKNGNNPFYTEIKNLFAAEMKYPLEKNKPSSPETDEFQDQFIDELNRVIQNKEFDRNKADVKVDEKDIDKIENLLGKELCLIILKRLVFEKNFPGEIFDRIGTRLGMLACLYSYILNDYGNAGLNYFHRFGDCGQLNQAVEAFEKAIELNDKNSIAYYNLHNALEWRGHGTDTHKKIMDCLEKAGDDLAFAWPEILVASARYRLEYQREEIRETLKPKKDIPGRKEKKAEGISSELDKEIRKIIGKTKLSPLVKSFTDLKDLSEETIDKQLKKNIQVNRLDENDIQALKIWAEYLSIYVPNDRERFRTAEKLSGYILEDYYPDDFELNRSLLTMYKESGSKNYKNIKQEKLKGIKTNIDYRYDQDPINFNVLHMASKFYEINEFDKRIKKNTPPYDKPAYQHLLGCAYRHNEDFEEAKKYLEKACSGTPKEALYFVDIGNLYYKLYYLNYGANQLSKMKDAYSEACKLDPQNTEAQVKLFWTYLELEKEEQAEAAFKIAIKADQGNPDYLYELGNAFYGEEFYDKAAKLYQMAIRLDHQLNHQKAQYYASLGNAYLLLHKCVKAQKAYSKAIKLSPDNIDYHFWMGQIYHEKREYEKAAEEFQKIIKIVPKDFLYQVSLFLTYRQWGKDKEAKKVLESAIKVDPGNPYYLHELGKTFSVYEQPKESIELYKRAIKLDHDEASFFADLGEAYLSLPEEKWQDAKKAYLKASGLDPRNPNYLDKLGNIFIKLGELEKAVSHLIKALGIAQEPKYVNSLISACRQMKNRKQAKVFLRQALKYDPENKEIKQELTPLN
jgi:tetratricopeptide (TPR) repeat protein